MATLAPSVTLEDIKPVSFQPLFVERSELEQKQASHAFCTAVQYDGRSPAASRNSRMPPTSAPGMNGATPAKSYHICTGTGLTPTTSAPGLGSPLLRDCITDGHWFPVQPLTH